MFEQPDCLDLDKASHHVAQYCADCVEAFVCGTYIAQTSVIQKDFLHDEDGNGLGQLGASLHDT
jgi:hypothetical protein